MMEKPLKWHKRILAFLIFLPNVMPLKMLFSTEIFPWAFLYTLRKDLKITLAFGVFLVYLIVSATINLGSFSSLQVPARAFFALVNACLIFFLLMKIKKPEFEQLGRIFDWVFWASVVVCLLQATSLFPDFLVPFMKIFIDRFEPVSLGGGRGVSGLFAEPSYASIAMHYYFAYYLLRHKITPNSKKGIFAIVCMVLFDLFIIRSLTGSIMIIIYLGSFMSRKTIFRGLLFFSLLSITSLWLMKRMNTMPRSVEVVYDFFYYREYKDPMPILLEQSGFRFISIWSSYRYGLVNPFGSGIGGWPNASVDAMDQIGVPASNISFFATLSGTEFFGVRPTSFAAGLMLETGFIGLILFLIAFWPFLFRKELYQDLHTRSLTMMFLFNLFVLGTIGDPVPFIFMALTYRGVFPPDETQALPPAELAAK